MTFLKFQDIKLIKNMKIISFDDNSNKIKRDPEQWDLFNLFQKNIMYAPSLTLYIYIVPREYEMRLDRISNHIYGSPDYVEELMILNDIINPYSVKEGQYIYFCDNNLFSYLYTKDELFNNADLIKKLNSSNKSSGNQTLSTSTNLQQLKINKDNSVQIINAFE